MKQILGKIKPYLRWVIIGATLFFLLKAFKDRWQEIVAVRINGQGWLLLATALIITVTAHIWSGWVWTWILKAFQQPIATGWGLRVYLTTNIAKYLPGNVWHYYGRIQAIKKHGGSLEIASLIVILEPLLMAAAALLIALIGKALGLIALSSNQGNLSLEILGLIVVLLGIHPRLLNPAIAIASRLKGNPTEEKLTTYPLLPLLGEMGFLILRGTGFLFCLWAIVPINLNQIPQLLTAFSFAWLLGLIVPGAPGGLGVFEATVIALLHNQNNQEYAAAIVIGVALYRAVSILAEALAAAGAWLIETPKRDINKLK